tara:strand:+ start:1373 stop:1768 length:396 start_codon:yes stop_codon:yes gene_type:complete
MEHSPDWREGCIHAQIMKKALPNDTKDTSASWYGHYWNLRPTPWVGTFWSGNEGLEYDHFPKKSPSNFDIYRWLNNKDELQYYGKDDSGNLFPLTEPFPEWSSKIINQLYSDKSTELTLRQVANIITYNKN